MNDKQQAQRLLTFFKRHGVPPELVDEATQDYEDHLWLEGDLEKSYGKQSFMDSPWGWKCFVLGYACALNAIDEELARAINGMGTKPSNMEEHNAKPTEPPT